MPLHHHDDPNHPENVALARAYSLQVPIIWFVGIEPGRYMPIFPVYVVGNEPEKLQFVLAVDEAQRSLVPDAEAGGEPVVPNGMSLCKIHHAAYDANLLGISPDYEININQALLEETDGPMLRHGLQEMHGRQIHPPRSRRQRPDRDRLEQRFKAFRNS